MMAKLSCKHRAPAPRPDLTVAELADLYLAALAGRVSASTRKAYAYRLARFVEAHGDRRVDSITGRDGERHRRQMTTIAVAGRGGRPARVSEANRTIAALRACWRWALACRVIPFGANPFRLNRLPSPAQVHTTGDSFATVLRHCPDPSFRRFLLTVRYTGVRQRDLRRLRADQVDWQHGCFSLPSSRPHCRSARLVYFPPLVGRLLRWCIDHAPAGSPLVFTNGYGRPWAECTLYEGFMAARRRAGAGPDAVREGMSFRNLRTAFVRTALELGVCPPTVRQLMGQSPLSGDGDPASPEALADIVRRIEAALLPGPAGC